jgi:hypothetical protein
MTLNDCKLYDLPRIPDPRGSLSFVEGGVHVPFDIKRVFYIYDVPTGESRGAHAHRELYQLLICLSGSFDVALEDASHSKIERLNRPWKGLLIPPMIWAAQINFDPGTVCLVLASQVFRESEYIRDHSTYLTMVRG